MKRTFEMNGKSYNTLTAIAAELGVKRVYPRDFAKYGITEITATANNTIVAISKSVNILDDDATTDDDATQADDTTVQAVVADDKVDTATDMADPLNTGGSAIIFAHATTNGIAVDKVIDIPSQVTTDTTDDATDVKNDTAVADDATDVQNDTAVADDVTTDDVQNDTVVADDVTTDDVQNDTVVADDATDVQNDTAVADDATDVQNDTVVADDATDVQNDTVVADDATDVQNDTADPSQSIISSQPQTEEEQIAQIEKDVVDYVDAAELGKAVKKISLSGLVTMVEHIQGDIWARISNEGIRKMRLIMELKKGYFPTSHPTKSSFSSGASPWKKISTADLITAATATGKTWKDCSNEGILRMRLIMVLKAAGVTADTLLK